MSYMVRRPTLPSARPSGPSPSRRRTLLPASALVAVFLVLAACSPAEENGEADGQASETETAETERADELVIGYGEDGWATGEENGKRFPGYPSPNANVCEQLVNLTRDFGVEPGLATDWEFVGDNTFRFQLREDVEFADGEPFNADAVVHAFDYAAEEPSVTGLAFVDPGSTKAVDEYTVEVTPEEPNRRLVEQINHPSFSVHAPGSDPLEAPQDINCTGPYQVVEYAPEEHLIVERNENYRGDPAETERIEFRFLPDDSNRLLALQSGEVDAIAEVPRPQVSAVEDMDEAEVVRAPPGQVILFYIAQRGPDGKEKVTGDVDVRRAIAHAIDRDAYIEGVLGGEAEPVNHVSPPEVLGEYADMVEGVPYDPEQAEQLLEEAGWEMGDDGVRERDGERLVLDIVYGPDRIDQPTVEFVQSQLAEVGIEGNIRQLETAAYRDAIDSGDYHIDLSSPNQNNANPAFLLNLRWYSQSYVDTAEFNAPGPDTEYDRLIEEIHQVTDRDELKRLSAEAMHELVDNEVATVPLAGTYRIYGMKAGMQGFKPHPSGTNQTWESVYLGE